MTDLATADLATAALDAAIEIDRAIRGRVVAPAGVARFSDRLASLSMREDVILSVAMGRLLEGLGHAMVTVDDVDAVLGEYAAEAMRLGCGEPADGQRLLAFCLAMHSQGLTERHRWSGLAA